MVADSVEKKTSWWAIARDTVLAELVIFGTFIFIKGFIDAGDVEVSTIFIRTVTPIRALYQFDVGKALMSALGGGLSGAAGQSSSERLQQDFPVTPPMR